MPLVGLGVWQIPAGRETEQAVAWALEAGYRHVDTAPSYRNEEGVGRAVRASGLPREEVFVTTKMTPGAGDPERELAGSLARLGLDWVDLYLIHWPTGASDAVWPDFERLHARGLARAIGVSNYDPGRLGRLVARAAVPPMVNQVDFSSARPRSSRGSWGSRCRQPRSAAKPVACASRASPPRGGWRTSTSTPNPP